VVCRTCPQESGHRLPPGCGYRRPRPATVPADQFLRRTPGSGSQATDMAEPPTVRSAGHPSPMGPPGRWARTRPACERPAADTSNAERRPCALPADYARGPLILAMTEQSNGHTRLWPTPAAASALGPLVMTTCIHAQGQTSGTLVPVRCPRGPVSGVQVRYRRHDRTGFRTPHARSYLGGHGHPIRHAIAELEGTRTGDGRSARQQPTQRILRRVVARSQARCCGQAPDARG
jgi:hypothetical protein